MFKLIYTCNLLILMTYLVFCDEHPQHPNNLASTFSEINSDGTFELSSAAGNTIILLAGSMIEINGTQSFEIFGYYSNGTCLIKWDANGTYISGCAPPVAPALAPRTVATILG
ncbi:unnamed protein product [Hermetia illucens]|uniref:Uncharacterized protein n=1 Tax=Hermetia illucens TaxID=343691 RepID=A0A7R8YW31_HERIL|nr:uncharacterized protein LOC119652301 [Hermetia illucens]CAD7084420.1 unnamed protein product [Hermetia illucens]